MAELEKKIVVPVEGDTSPLKKGIDKAKKEAKKNPVEIQVDINLKEMNDSLKAIKNIASEMKNLFNKDIRFEGLQKGLDGVLEKLEKVTVYGKKGKPGEFQMFKVDVNGLKSVYDEVNFIHKGIDALNNEKINLDSFNKLADILKNIETLMNSIVKGMNFDTIRPSVQVQEDIESTTEKLEQLAKTEKKINQLEKYLNSKTGGISKGKQIIEFGDSEDVNALDRFIEKMKEYISLGGDLSKITFKAFNIEKEKNELYSLVDVLEILEDEGKIDFIDEKKISNDVSTIKTLRNELDELNKELIDAKNRENRDLNVSLDTKSIEKFSASITEAFKKIENLQINIPEGLSFDGLSAENLDKIIGKFDEIVSSIKGISDLLSTGVDTSKLKNIEVNVEPKVDVADFVKKIEEKLEGAVVEVKTKVSAIEEETKSDDPVLVDNSVIDGIKSTLKDISEDFGFNLTQSLDIREDLETSLRNINFENLLSSLKESLLEIVKQFQNSLESVNFSSSQLDDLYKTLKGWSDADSYAANKAGKIGGERGAFINLKTGQTSNTFFADNEGSFSNVLFNALKELAVGIDGEISSIYDAWIHSHPFRKTIEGLKAIGSDTGFSIADLDVGIDKALKEKIPNMLATNNYKYTKLDLSGVAEADAKRLLEEYRKELLNSGLKLDSNGKMFFPKDLAKEGAKFNSDKKTEIMNDAMRKALSNVGLETSRLTSGNIEDLKVDLSALQEQEQKASEEAKELIEVFRKLGNVLDGFSGESFKFGISEDSLDGIISKLNEIVELLKIVGKTDDVNIDTGKNVNYSGTLSQKFDNEIQQNLVYLENYKNTIKEIDRLKLEPETDETIQKMKELNSLADYYVSHISVLRSENHSSISPAGMKDMWGMFAPGLASEYTNSQLEEFYKLGQEKYGLKFGLDLPNFTVIGDEIVSIESKSESLRVSLEKNLMDSQKYVEDLRRKFVTLTETTDDLKTETSPKWIETLNKEIEKILSKYPELEQFKDKFTYDQAKEFIKTDSWNDFLSTLPQAQKYLESIGYEFKNIDPNNVLRDTSTDVGTTGMAHEASQAEELKGKINAVTTAVDLKTRAFQEEEQVVVGTVQREVTSLEVLDGQLWGIIGTIEKLQSTPISIDLKLLDDENANSNINKLFTDLNEKIQGLDIESLSKLSEVLKGLKIPGDSAENLNKVATALVEFKNSVAGMSVGENDFLSSINAILSKKDELSNLAKILETSTKKINEAVDAVNSSGGKKSSRSPVDELKSDIEGLNRELKKSFGGKDDFAPLRFLNSLDEISKKYKELQKLNLSDKSKVSDNDMLGLTAYMQTFKDSIGKMSLDKISTENKTPEFISQLNQAKNSLEDVKVVLDKVASGEAFTDDDIAKIKLFVSQVRELNKVSNDGSNKFANSSKVSNLLGNLAETLSKNTAMSKELRQEFESLQAEMKAFGGNIPIDEFTKFGHRFEELKTKMKEGSTGLSFFDGIIKKARSMSQSFIGMYLSLYDIVRYVRTGLTTIKELDTALTEMRKVSDESVQSLKNFQAESFDIAGSVGTTAQQIQNSTADFMRIGESLDEAANSAKVSNILLNVSEFESIDEATESLVAMSAAYNELDKIEIVDKLNNIGNNFAISTDGLATALQRSASALKTAGNDMDEAIALVTAGNQVVQNPDSVGAGLRTIALRITGTEAAKAELEELGEDTSDFMVQTSAKSQQAIKDFTKVASNNFEGFDILDDNGNFKSTYEILAGISEIYGEIVETDKKYGSNMANGLLETLAGKNRANIAASILQNPDILKDVYESSQDSDGSAQQELDKYLDSIEGKVEQFKNEAQEFWYNLISSDAIKLVVDMGTIAVDWIGNIVGALGELGVAITAITTAFTIKSISNGGNGISDMFKRTKKELEDVASMFNNTAVFNGNVVNSSIDKNILAQLNMGYNIDGGMTSGYSEAITKLASSYKGATAEANALKMAQDGLSQSTINDVLAKQNWSQAERERAVASDAFKAAQTASTAATQSDTAATWLNVAASKALAVAKMALKTAVGMAVGMIVSAGISAFVKLADSVHQTREELKETAEEIRNTYKSTSEEIASDLSMISEVEDEFKKLSNGVSDYGENISLTADEYSRYKEIVSKILATNPALVKGYNSEGEAIANKNTLLQESVDLLKEKQKLELQDYISDKTMKTLGMDAVEDIKDYKSENPLPYGDAKYNFMKSFAAAASRYDAENKFEGNYELFKAISPEGYDWNNYGSSSIDATNFSGDYFDSIVKDLRSGESVLKAYFKTSEIEELLNFANQYDQNIETYNSRIDSYAKALNPTLQLVASAEEGYDKLSAAQKNFLTSYINGFEITSETTEADILDMKAQVKDLVDSIVDNDGEISNAINDLFSADLSTLPIKEAQSKIDNNIGIIAKALKKDAEELKVQFGFDEYKIDFKGEDGLQESIGEKAKKALKESEKGELETLTLGDIKIAATISPYLDENSLNIDELKTQIENYKYTGLDGFTSSEMILGDLGIGYSIRLDGVAGEAQKVIQSAVRATSSVIKQEMNGALGTSFEPPSFFKDDELAISQAFLDDVDNFILKSNELKVALGKINDGSWDESDFDKLSETFKDLPKDTDELKNSITGLLLSMESDIISEFSGQFDKVDSREARLELEKFMHSVTELVDVVGNTEFSISMETETESYQNLATAMTESTSATGLTAESIENLKDRYSELEDDGYDINSMFETTANGIHLNREKLNELEDAYRQNSFENVEAELQNLKDKYDNLTQEIENTTDATLLSDLYLERSNLGERINELGMLASQYEGLSSAYNKWQIEQSAGNERDMYEGIIGGFEEIEDEWSRGWFDDDTVAFLELITGKNISSLSFDDQVAEYEKLENAVNSAGHSIKDFFTVDENGKSTNDGVFNFLETIDANDKLTDAVTIEDGVYSFDFSKVAEYEEIVDEETGKVTRKLIKTGDQVIAEALGISEELVHIMLRAADDAGFVVDLEGNFTQYSTLKEEAEAAAIALNDLNAAGEGGTEHVFDFSVNNLDSVTSELEEAEKLLDTYRDKETGLIPDTTNAKAALSIVEYYATLRDKLTEPAYMNLDVSDVDKELQPTLEMLKEYETLSDEEYRLRISQENPEELENIQTRMSEIVKTISENEDLKVKLGIEGATETEIQEMLENGTLEFPAKLDLELEMTDSIQDISTLLQRQMGLIDDIEMKIRLGYELTEAEQLQYQIDQMSEESNFTVSAQVEGKGYRSVGVSKGEDGTITYETIIDGEWTELEQIVNADGTYSFKIKPEIITPEGEDKGVWNNFVSWLSGEETTVNLNTDYETPEGEVYTAEFETTAENPEQVTEEVQEQADNNPVIIPTEVLNETLPNETLPDDDEKTTEVRTYEEPEVESKESEIILDDEEATQELEEYNEIEAEDKESVLAVKDEATPELETYNEIEAEDKESTLVVEDEATPELETYNETELEDKTSTHTIETVYPNETSPDVNTSDTTTPTEEKDPIHIPVEVEYDESSGEQAINEANNQMSGETVEIEGEADASGIEENINNAIDEALNNSNLTEEQKLVIKAFAEVFGAEDIDDLDEKLNSLYDVEIQAIAEVIGKVDVEKLKSAIDLLEDEEIQVIAEALGEGNVYNLGNAIDSLEDKKVQAIAEALGYQDVESLKTAINNLEPNTVQAIAEVFGISDTNTLIDAIDRLDGKNVNVVANTSGLSAVDNLRTAISNLKDKTVNIWTRIFGGGVTEADGTAHVEGTAKASRFNAYANGTAMSMWNSYRSSIGAYAKGADWTLPKDENALVNEIGTESIVRDGKWFPIPGGAHIEQLKKGDIVFSAAQTEELVRTGRVISGGGHGKVARSDGTAFNMLNAYSGGTAFSGMNAYGGSTGSKTKRKKTTYKGKGSVTQNNSGNGNNSGNNNGNNNNNNNNDNNKDAKDFLETLDWIVEKIEYVEHQIEELDQTASATYKSWTERNTALVDEMAKVTEEIDWQTQAQDAYLAKANSITISKDKKTDKKYKQLVQSGDIKIEDIKNEKIAEKIKEYQEWYDKSVQAGDAIKDLKDRLAELARQKFDNVVQEYEDQLSAVEHEANVIDALINKTETSGHIVSSKYYDELIKRGNETKSLLEKEYTDLQNELATAMASGDIKYQSEEWYAMQSQINEVQESIIEADTSLIEFKNSIRQLKWDAFDRLQERISNITEEADFLISLMEDSELYEDNGQLTDTGMATMGLHGQDYNVYMAQADKYAEEMKRIEKDLAKDEGKGNQDLIKRRQELLELQRESILAANDEKMAIRDMVEEGINKELEALQERIDKYKEAKQNAKDLYDYQKNISDQVKEISSLEKQMTAYQGDDSEENKQRVQQLKVQLEEAKENLEQTEMEHALSEAEKMLDELYANYEEVLNERLDNIDLLLEDMIIKINENSDSISQTLTEEAEKVGYSLSESMQNIWNNDGAATAIIAKYGENFITQLTTVNSVLNAISEKLSTEVEQEDKKAEDEIKQNQDKPVEKPKKEEPKKEEPKKEEPKKTETKKKTTTKKTIKKGGKINAKGAKIYDYKGDTSGESQYFKKDPVYKVLKIDGNWLQVRHHKLSSGVTGWFKKNDVKAYKTGGLVDETGLAWLDGTKGKPELVLNASDTENFIELTEAMRKLSDADISAMMSNMSPMYNSLTPISPGYIPNNNVSQNMNNVFNMTFELHDVTNGEQVINYLIKSDRFENAVKAMTVDRLAGGSKFSKSKYKS